MSTCADDHAAWREEIADLKADVEMWRKIAAARRPVGPDDFVRPLTEVLWRLECRHADSLADEPVEVQDGFRQDATHILAELAPLIDQARADERERIAKAIEAAFVSNAYPGAVTISGARAARIARGDA